MNFDTPLKINVDLTFQRRSFIQIPFVNSTINVRGNAGSAINNMYRSDAQKSHNLLYMVIQTIQPLKGREISQRI